MSDNSVTLDRGIETDRAFPVNPDPGLPGVLLVDDQPARLLACEAILTDLPVRCVRALSGEEALAQLLKQQFAVIVLDVSMPGMDGFETARLIRAHHRFQKTPILLVTGVHLTEIDRLKGYEVGAIDYLFLPFVPEILRSKIAILVELYQRRRELEELTQALVVARSHLQASEATDAAGVPGPATEDSLSSADRSDEMLRNAAHDLRNALAPIHYLIEMLVNKTAETNPIRPVLQTIRQYNLRIARLADEFDARGS
jgi:DNA-binding response OmpR family regulator